MVREVHFQLSANLIYRQSFHILQYDVFIMKYFKIMMIKFIYTEGTNLRDSYQQTVKPILTTL